MGFVLSLLLSYPVSYVLKLVNRSDIAKDAAKNGYVVDIDKFKEESQNNVDKIIKSADYLPYLNILSNLLSVCDYKINRQQSFETMRVYGFFEPMTKEEEEYFNEKPTALRAFNIASKRKENIDKKYKDNLKSNIKYYDNNLDDHEIILKENDEYIGVELDDYIETLSKDELEDLKMSLLTLKRWRTKFKEEENEEADYTLNGDNDKKLILRFKCKNNDNKEKNNNKE